MPDLSVLLFTLIGVSLPAAVYLAIAIRFGRPDVDKPRWLLTGVFLWGAIPSIIAAMAANRFLNWLMDYDVNAEVTSAHQAFAATWILGFLQPAAEECLKALPLIFVFLFVRRYFASPNDGILFAAVVGMGFGVAENIQYVYRAGVTSGIPIAMAVVVMRSILFGLAHSLWSTPFGIGLGLARTATSNTTVAFAPVVGLALSVLMHGLHNASFLWATLGRSYGVFAVVINLAIYAAAFVAWLVFAFKREKHDESAMRENAPVGQSS